jgi:small subunit ribosomal protein S27
LVFRDLRALSKRNYLTSGYKLNEEWAKRLTTPILQKVSIENLYYDIDSKFSQQKKMSPADVDIYANKVIDDKHMDEIADLMQKLRKTEEATNLFDSTQHALVRNYIDNDNLDSLVHVLNHRQEYGVFLDSYTANMLLDKLIEAKNFKLGARFATLFALQEDLGNPIATQMSLFACYKFLGNLETFDDLFVAPVVEEGKPKSKKKDEIKVRVFFLRNPHFDDHFDVKNTNHLVGKTILYLADEIHASNEVLGNSLRLVGYSLYEKFDKANEFLESAKSATFYKETVEIVKSSAEKVENLEANESAMKFFDAVSSLSNLKDENVGELIEKSMKQAINDHEKKDIDEQKKIYAIWNEERQQKLDAEIARLNRIQRLVNVEKVQEDLQAEEKKLWFFDNEDQIDLEIEGKRVFYPKRWFGKHLKPRVVDENYVPPDVDHRRNTGLKRSRKAR